MPEFIVIEKVQHYNTYKFKARNWKAAKKKIEQAAIRTDGSRDLPYRHLQSGPGTWRFVGTVRMETEVYDPEVVSVDSGDRSQTFYEKGEEGREGTDG